MAGGERRGPEALPQQFGNYSVLEHLATGGMAEVYLARKVGLQGFEKFVVLKRVRPELTHQARTMAQFLDEARLVATLEHPNIAQVYEIERVSDSYFIVMEYVQGADLHHIMKVARQAQRRISLDDAIYIVTHVCAALHYAHEKCDLDGNPLDIIHRDVSPSNVLVSHDGAVKVCDFGIAKGRKNTAETMEGVVKGKLSYMSPEQCRSEPLDRLSDIFALGILLYELTTMTKLFPVASEFEMLRTIIEDPIPHPSQRVAGYPDDLAAIVLRALAKRPRDRYPTAQAMQADLEAFAREHKLAMSSINIARLMGRLFERPSGSSRARHGFDEGEADTDVSTLERPLQHAEGSGQPRAKRPTRGSQRARATPTAPPPMATPAKVAATPAPLAERRPSMLWVAGAALAIAGAAAATFVPASQPDTAAAEQELRVDVERLAATIDAAARTSQLEVSRISTAPTLRAAISTDAATLRDLAANEHLIAAAPGEVLEIFQLRGTTMSSLLRLPADAPPIVVTGTAAQIQLASDGRDLRVIATSPVDGTGATGAVASSTPIDLALATQAFAKTARDVRLVGVTPELVLVPGAANGPTIRIAAPTASLPGSALAIAATIDAAAEKPGWIGIAQLAALGVGVFLLVCYAVLRARR